MMDPKQLEAPGTPARRPLSTLAPCVSDCGNIKLASRLNMIRNNSHFARFVTGLVV